jgi:hypothetical protein
MRRVQAKDAARLTTSGGTQPGFVEPLPIAVAGRRRRTQKKKKNKVN